MRDLSPCYRCEVWDLCHVRFLSALQVYLLWVQDIQLVSCAISLYYIDMRLVSCAVSLRSAPSLSLSLYLSFLLTFCYGCKIWDLCLCGLSLFYSIAISLWFSLYLFSPAMGVRCWTYAMYSYRLWSVVDIIILVSSHVESEKVLCGLYVFGFFFFTN